jgi:hypothetical protein
MSDFLDFIYENYKFIIAIALSIIGLLVFISIKDIKFNEPKLNTNLVQTVTIESFDTNTKPNIVDDSLKSGLVDYNQQPALGSLYKSGTDTGVDYTQIIPLDGQSNFCQKYSSSPKDLQQACKNISNSTCQNLPCCALIGSGEDDTLDTCVAANKNGISFKTDPSGNLISMDHYYYQGEKYNVSQ